jgi:hypothetical protein
VFIPTHNVHNFCGFSSAFKKMCIIKNIFVIVFGDLNHQAKLCECDFMNLKSRFLFDKNFSGGKLNEEETTTGAFSIHSRFVCDLWFNIMRNRRTRWEKWLGRSGRF